MAKDAPLSCRIRRTWSTDRVGYTGVVTAPALRIARSANSHSGRLSDRSTTRSPARRPKAVSPRLRSRTRSSRSCPLVAVMPCASHRPIRSGFGNLPLVWNGSSAIVGGTSITSVAVPLIDQIEQRLATFETGEILHEQVDDRRPEVAREGRRVGRDQDVRQSPQRAAGGQRLV